MGVRLAVGFFDGVHLGHQKILSGANAVLTFRNHPLSVLAPDRCPPLLMNLYDRLETLATAGAKRRRDVRAIAFTQKLASCTPEQFASYLRREFPGLERIHCGGNWRFGAGGAGTPSTLRALGFDVKVVRYAKYMDERVSSTRIRKALAEGDVAAANAMLGHRFFVTGAVAGGKGIGRTLGSPTLNLMVAPPLKCGVYAVDTPLGCGVANFGVAPTMGRLAWAAPVLEVHLIDGHALDPSRPPEGLRVEFREFLRPEMTFGSREALGDQIAADIEKVKAMCDHGMIASQRGRGAKS